MSAFGRWLQERIPITGVELRELTNEPVPNHLKRWWFALGGTPAYLFVIQIVTGILLSFYYEAAPQRAYESIQYITKEAAYGWYFRSLHKWGATFMIAAVILHQTRVYFTAAYRKPRELNWVIGMGLLLTTLMLGFTGYSLAFEQLSYWGATVASNITDQVPVVGPVLKQFILAGQTYNQRTLPRFYIVHAAVLPATMVILLVIHIAFIRMLGISELRFEDEPATGPQHYSFFPDHLYTEIILGLSLMVILSALATIFPATMGPKANPLSTPEVIKPEWYFYTAFRWLKLFSGTFAVLSSGLIVVMMIVWPWIDGLVRRITRWEEISTYLGIVAVVLLIGLTTWEALVPH